MAKGWSSACWMYKIIVPVSLLTFFLEQSGLLEKGGAWLEPVMGLLQLPARAALPLVVGMLTTIYGAIASMLVLGLSQREMTLLAIFILISHGLIQETIVQAKSGLSPFKALAARLTASIVTVGIIGWFWPADGVASANMTASTAAIDSLQDAFLAWGAQLLWLCAQVLLIVMGLMVLLEALKHFNWIDRIVRVVRPLLRLMGLDDRVGTLWLTAALFGITYGAAAIVAETRDGDYDPVQLERLQLSIGINHAMIEDPALFLPLGILPVWLWLPRLVAAVAMVRLTDFLRWLRSNRKTAATN